MNWYKVEYSLIFIRIWIFRRGNILSDPFVTHNFLFWLLSISVNICLCMCVCLCLEINLLWWPYICISQASACLAGDSAAYHRTAAFGDDVVIVAWVQLLLKLNFSYQTCVLFDNWYRRFVDKFIWTYLMI